MVSGCGSHPSLAGVYLIHEYYDHFWYEYRCIHESGEHWERTFLKPHHLLCAYMHNLTKPNDPNSWMI